MALTWTAALTSTNIYGQHGNLSRDKQAFPFVREPHFQYGNCKPRHRDIFPKQKKSVILHASVGETVEDKGTESGKEENAPEKSVETGATESPAVSPTSPFVGAKISSRIAAREAETTNGRSTSSTATPPNPFTKTSSSEGTPTLNPKTPSSQGIPTVNPISPSSLGKPTFSPKPISSQSFSPKPPSPQGGPFSSPLTGPDKLKGAKPSIFLNSRAGEFKQPGPKGLMDALREAEGIKATKFGQPIVPTNLFDEPEKLTAEEKKIEFSLNADQLVLIFSFLTIMSIMLGTAFVVWKLGGIHYNEF